MSQKCSLTQIRKTLQQCQFNPKEPGPMKVIADTGNKEYYLLRAMETIQGARELANPTKELRQAIGLLALALVEIENGRT